MSSIGGVGGGRGTPAPSGGFSAAGAGGAAATEPYHPRSSVLEHPDFAAVGRGEKEIASGARGDAVRGLQDALIVLGLLPRRPGADGIFGRGTQGALAAFQRGAGLQPTGKLDRTTLEAIDRRLADGPTANGRALPAPDPLAQHPSHWLKNQGEKNAYETIQRLLFTGASLRYGIDAAVTDQDTDNILRILDALPNGYYNNVLHALAATKVDDPRHATLLDKLIVRGTSQFGHASMSQRFCDQLERKLRPLGSSPENKILRHISPDSVDRLKGWAGWARLIDLIG